jgi:hypothetical protein
VRRALTRLRLSLLAGLCLALTSTAVASADEYVLKMTPAGKAAAHAAVLTRADLGSASGWKGGAVKPDLTTDPPCKGYNPKHADLVIVGAAAATFDHSGLGLHSETQVLRSARMLQLDWQRSNAPGEIDCARTFFDTSSSASQRFVSLRRMAFPRVAPYTTAFRLIIDVTGASREIIRMATDVIFVGKGRTEITLLTTAPLEAMASVRPVEVALATRMLARVRT